MKLNPTRHEDERRILTEYIKDTPFRRAKVIEVKEDMLPLGKHYHLKSDSVFFLLRGHGTYVFQPVEPVSRPEIGMFKEGDCLFCPRGIVHTFQLSKGSILLETASEPYDKEDEIQVTN